MRRFLAVVALCGVAATTISAQSFFKNQPPRIALETRTEGALASPSRTAIVTVLATPVPNVHVYAPGNAEYIPVGVALTAVEGLRFGEPVFPAGEPYFFAPLKQAVTVYSKPFRVRVPVTATAAFLKERAAGAVDAVALKGVVSYQACDDKVCFPPQTLAFTVDVPVRPKRASR